MPEGSFFDDNFLTEDSGGENECEQCGSTIDNVKVFKFGSGCSLCHNDKENKPSVGKRLERKESNGQRYPRRY